MMNKKILLKIFLATFLITCGWTGVRPLAAQTVDAAVQTRELSFTNGDVQLSGTLYLPVEDGPFVAAVIMHGAGPDTRTPYVPDAKMLAEAGIAAFIFDKRGTGASTGDWRRASLDDLMADGLAAVALLRSQPEIDSDNVGILGSSQGAWLAPFMAAQSRQVAFFVQITGSATPLANQEMWDDGNSLRALGFSERAIATEMKALHLLYSSRELIRRGILPLGELWFVYHDPTMDPAAAWAQMSVPALVLYGGRDNTVPTETSLAIVQDALAEGGHPASRIVVFLQQGHALGGGARNQDETYATLVTGWIKAVANDDPMPVMSFSDDNTRVGGLRWYGIGAMSTPWYATAVFQLPVMIAFLLLFVGAVIVSLLPGVRFSDLNSRLVVGTIGAVNSFLLVGLVLVLNYLLNADAESLAPEVPLSGGLFPLAWGSLLLTAALTYFWQRGREGAHPALTLFVVVAWGYLLFLGYWGLFGGWL